VQTDYNSAVLSAAK